MISINSWPFNEIPADAVERGQAFAKQFGIAGTHAAPELLQALCSGFSHRGYWIEAESADQTTGILPVVYMNTKLFGKFLVSLPYLNWGGVIASDNESSKGLIDHAVELADKLDVQFLELRHESEVQHPKLTEVRSEKCQMRMPVENEESAWKGCRSTVRTQVRKGDKQNFEIEFGQTELLDRYYQVFARNMRDLGTPVFSRSLFRNLLDQLDHNAELCVVSKERIPIACALTFHHPNGLSEVPSASALREHRKTAVNTWMYWQLIKRAIERGADTFDFGRSTPDGPTFDFKRKWGATPSPVAWQYYLRRGTANQVRPDNSKYDRAIRIWQKLPMWVANTAGPMIVRGIP